MKRLYVGCRVRVVRTHNFPQFTGREAVIVRRYRDAWDGETIYDGWKLNFTTPFGASYVAKDGDLEPIQDPGHQIVSWEAMKNIWTPKGIPA